MDAKLIRIRDLINEKERIESELSSLIAGTPVVKGRRGRKKKSDTTNGATEDAASPTLV